MKSVSIQIDDPRVQELNKQASFIPTFEIMNNGRSYVCDPRPAVDNARIVFQAYSASRLFGSIEMNVPDPTDVLKDIIFWLHGGSLKIESKRAQQFITFADALGIPLIGKWARIVSKDAKYETAT